MNKKQLLLLLVASLVFWTGGTGVLPLLPVYATQLGASPILPCPCRPPDGIMIMRASLRSDGWTACPELVDGFISLRREPGRASRHLWCIMDLLCQNTHLHARTDYAPEVTMNKKQPGRVVALPHQGWLLTGFTGLIKL